MRSPVPGDSHLAGMYDVHYRSRTSLYPGTTVMRFPVSCDSHMAGM